VLLIPLSARICQVSPLRKVPRRDLLQQKLD